MRRFRTPIKQKFLHNAETFSIKQVFTSIVLGEVLELKPEPGSGSTSTPGEIIEGLRPGGGTDEEKREFAEEEWGRDDEERWFEDGKGGREDVDDIFLPGVAQDGIGFDAES